jgi:hypothetical protein
MEESIKQDCLNKINEVYLEIENTIDFSQSKLQIQLQRANVQKEFLENASDKCVEIINLNYTEKEKASNIIEFVQSKIKEKSIELMGY